MMKETATAMGYSSAFLDDLNDRVLRQPAVRDASEYGPDQGALEVFLTFRALVLDADGVWWDGRESRSFVEEREPGALNGASRVVVHKTRDLRDGQGLSFLRALGVRVLFATAEGEPLVSCVEKLNRLPSVSAGRWPPVDVLTGLRGGKAGHVSRWLEVHGLSWDDVVYVGDDRTDAEAMRLARMVVVPWDAQRVALRLAHLRLTKPGGGGAIRELAELVIDARGADEERLPDA